MTRTVAGSLTFSRESMKKIEKALVTAGYSDENLEALLKEIDFMAAKRGVTSPMRREQSPRPPAR